MCAVLRSLCFVFFVVVVIIIMLLLLLLFSALPKIITNGYKALNLHYFFTCGHDEVRAWTIMVCGPFTY